MRIDTQVAGARGALGIVAFAFVIGTGIPKAPGAPLPPRGSPVSLALAGPGSPETLRDDYAKLPIAFEENAGQVDRRVRYFARGNRFGLYLTEEEVVLAFARNADRGVALALRFVGRNPHAVVEGVDRAPGEVNYFLGNDPAAWKTHLSRYGRVVYRELWPGVDLQLREESGVLKYEFHVRPAARLSDIHLAYAGAAGISIDGSGALLVDTGDGVLRDAAPVAWQELGGERVPVQSRYAL